MRYNVPMDNHETFLRVLQQRHRLPDVPVRQCVVDAINRLTGRVTQEFSPATGTVRLFIGDISRAFNQWASPESCAIGEVGWAWHEERDAVPVWRTAWGYPVSGSQADDKQPWRMAKSVAEAYAMVVASVLRQDHPELAVNEYLHAMTNEAGHPHIQSIKNKVAHRNIRLVVRDGDARSFYDPDENAIVAATAARLNQAWHGVAVKLYDHGISRGIGVEHVVNGDWAVRSLQPMMYVVAMDNTYHLYDIRYGARIMPNLRDAIAARRGRLRSNDFLSELGTALGSIAEYQPMTTTSNQTWRHNAITGRTMPAVVTGVASSTHTRPWGRAWVEIDDCIDQYETARCPDWLEANDNRALVY